MRLVISDAHAGLVRAISEVPGQVLPGKTVFVNREKMVFDRCRTKLRAKQLLLLRSITFEASDTDLYALGRFEHL